MYEWIGYTWNPLAGECPHQCEYCYVKSLIKRYPSLRKKYTGEIRLDEKALNQKLPRNRTIFVASMNDLFANGVPEEYIRKILEKTREQEKDRVFLFQTKNPKRMIDFAEMFPKKSIFATTIESNRNIIKTNAPSPEERARDFRKFKGVMMDYAITMNSFFTHQFEITIEPILDFDLPLFATWIECIEPDFVSIGADSKGHHLPEPSEKKVVELVRRIERITHVRLKKNLRRIAPSLFSQLRRDVDAQGVEG